MANLFGFAKYFNHNTDYPNLNTLLSELPKMIRGALSKLNAIESSAR